MDTSGLGGGAPSFELQQFLEQEKQKAMVNELVAKLTDSCWEKCMGTPGSKLSSGETACFSNCAQRFLETSQLILQKFERMQQG
ncbi:TIM8 mitochondrial import inner membrane translocon protein [Klebsormidium nitens]|uniref:Mitochondrial import inner membrane translocase subunit n=1 Tax=Klebsormidium nitens TaxID=105231 RepID=A0A1Y1HVK6_KLENI|nr:TIM8 mitochondrial import inner membrane translocon protein [Klebsormidium nitens]|eukprot:GAQ81229.1 TIM8 mitochondrial import inner membrane translocon protein [Klebsormidium nitens]